MNKDTPQKSYTSQQCARFKIETCNLTDLFLNNYKVQDKCLIRKRYRRIYFKCCSSDSTENKHFQFMNRTRFYLFSRNATFCKLKISFTRSTTWLPEILWISFNVIGWLSYEKKLWHLGSYWPEKCLVTPQTVSQVILTHYCQVKCQCMISKIKWTKFKMCDLNQNAQI